MTEEEQKAIEILSLKAITSSAEAPEYPNTIVMKKDLITVLNLISKLQADIDIKDKVIENLEKGNKELRKHILNYQGTTGILLKMEDKDE